MKHRLNNTFKLFILFFAFLFSKLDASTNTNFMNSISEINNDMPKKISDELDVPILNIYLSAYCGGCIKFVSTLINGLGHSDLVNETFDNKILDIRTELQRILSSDMKKKVLVNIHECSSGNCPNISGVPHIEFTFKTLNGIHNHVFNNNLFDNLDRGIYQIKEYYEKQMDISSMNN